MDEREQTEQTGQVAGGDAGPTEADYSALFDPEEPLNPMRSGVVELAKLRPRKMYWLWRGRIPWRAVTLLDGDPGLGKSLLALDIAARVTTGRPMPDGTPCLLPGVSGGVLILSAEDDPASTIVPRLRAAGADLERVRFINQAEVDEEETGKTIFRPLLLAAAEQRIEKAHRVPLVRARQSTERRCPVLDAPRKISQGMCHRRSPICYTATCTSGQRRTKHTIIGMLCADSRPNGHAGVVAMRCVLPCCAAVRCPKCAGVCDERERGEWGVYARVKSGGR